MRTRTEFKLLGARVADAVRRGAARRREREKHRRDAANRIGLMHASIAEFLLAHAPVRYTCVAYDLSDCENDLEIQILDAALPPARWACMTLRAGALEDHAIDIAGRGSAIRDVIFLLSVLGAVKDSDYVSLRTPDRPYLHTDYIRRTPMGAWLARRMWLVPHALRLAVLVARYRPFMKPASMAWRMVLRPLVLALGAVGGISAIREWLGV